MLDTNVLLAAFISRGACHELLEHCKRAHRIVASGFILREFEDKLLRKSEVPPEKAARALAVLRSGVEVIDPLPLEIPTCRDAVDDWVLATALAGRCACIVTGDKDLLALQVFSGIRILPPNAFWAYESEDPPRT